MLDFRSIDSLIELALAEDIGTGDITTEATVSTTQNGIGVIIVEDDGVIAGLPVVERVFQKIDPSLEFRKFASDSDRVKKMTPIAEVKGRVKPILTGERTALNFLQRLSGIATMTAQFVELAEKYDVQITDTRKSTAGWRVVQKYAVYTGGGKNHRFGLFDGILIKDNHIIAAGSVAKAVKKAKLKAPHTMKIEVEVETPDQVEEALSEGADILLLDNMSVELMRTTVKNVAGRALIEASGNITIDKVDAVAATGVDLISVGALTHSAIPLDMSLDLTLN
ncbi:MAG: carboxylating nicotinate-nucleotide diphosphorylase [Candidatus Poribacteria bacterium]|nr:carboxylating nicotinate-nucleotide diphosphorylase [Candidatus Poribacteria bacterium]